MLTQQDYPEFSSTSWSALPLTIRIPRSGATTANCRYYVRRLTIGVAIYPGNVLIPQIHSEIGVHVWPAVSRNIQVQWHDSSSFRLLHRLTGLHEQSDNLATMAQSGCRYCR